MGVVLAVIMMLVIMMLVIMVVIEWTGVFQEFDAGGKIDLFEISFRRLPDEVIEPWLHACAVEEEDISFGDTLHVNWPGREVVCADIAGDEGVDDGAVSGYCGGVGVDGEKGGENPDFSDVCLIVCGLAGGEQGDEWQQQELFHGEKG